MEHENTFNLTNSVIHLNGISYPYSANYSLVLKEVFLVLSLPYKSLLGDVKA